MVQSEQILEHEFCSRCLLFRVDKEIIKRVYLPRAMALAVWIVCPFVGMLRDVSLI